MTHNFHIPVMGTGFTIDTPLKVARFGISSVVSVDDHLMEAMREHYSARFGEAYTPIDADSVDSRARRITAYLNFLNRAVKKQVAELRESPFTPESEITKYFELLDDRSALKVVYRRMRELPAGLAKDSLQKRLRQGVEAGSIDVNILTKLDRARPQNGLLEPQEFSDAMAALRGFAQSDLCSSVVFSAGLNLHLFGYLESFGDFYPDLQGRMCKKITLKVSDFRSAQVQGKIFAKKGLWVSEYRIESGLNCGGHAFATQGHLMGPVLEEFRQKKDALAAELWGYYREALRERKNIVLEEAPSLCVTAQGGVGTSAEHFFLIRRYGLERTGWGSPFLLVPEATSVDDDTLNKLSHTSLDSIYLSDASPMGVPIYNLRESASEMQRKRRIETGKPGSPCLNGFMAFNAEFGAPLCTASSVYQQRKIEELQTKGLEPPLLEVEIRRVTEKACVCHDLGVGALLKNNIKPRMPKAAPAVCPGPNLVYFSKICSLQEMVSHIYGRTNVLDPAKPRSHAFINELGLYLNYFKKRVLEAAQGEKERAAAQAFKKNLLDGIAYYRELAADLLEETEQARKQFAEDLQRLKGELESCV